MGVKRDRAARGYALVLCIIFLVYVVRGEETMDWSRDEPSLREGILFQRKTKNFLFARVVQVVVFLFTVSSEEL